MSSSKFPVLARVRDQLRQAARLLQPLRNHSPELIRVNSDEFEQLMEARGYRQKKARYERD